MADGVSSLGLEAASGAYSKYSGTVTNTSSEDDTTYMDFDSYLKLLVSKMQNQDFNDPMSDSEVLQQMSSYSMLEGIKNMTAQSNISYATSLVGKAVTVNDGSSYDTGVVVSVVVENNTPYIIVNSGKYEVSAITDISDKDTYNTLSSLIGQQVDVKTAGADGAAATIRGEVTKVLIMNGSGYVVVDGKNLYPLSDVSLVKDGTSDTDKSESNEEGNSNGTTETTTQSVTVDPVLSSGYTTHSAALFEELMSTIDSISNNSTKTKTETSIIPDTSGYETVVTDFDIPDYAAGVFASQDEILYSLTANEPQVMALQSGNYDVPLNSSNANSVIASARDGRISGILTNNQAKDILENSNYETRYSARYGLEVKPVDGSAGISTSDCEPHRYEADKYPAEAALADSLGTRMFDIKWINNTAITSRIDTSNVIARSISGKEVTEIGYSGKGQLGEVVTFKDGTQRVEVILKNGTSSWHNTSGRYTLDQICDKNAAPGTLSDLTAVEKVIRHYAIKSDRA